MSDLAKLSNEQLKALISEKMSAAKPAVQANDLSSVSDDDLRRMITQKSAEPDRPLMTAAGLWEGFKQIPQTIDQYTGAPVRKFATEFATGESLDKAPTGAEQAKMMGMSDTSYKDAYGLNDGQSRQLFGFMGGASPADVGGFALEMVQDPLLIGSAIKSGVSGATKVARGAAEYLKGGSKQVVDAAQTQAAKAMAEGSVKGAVNISGGGSTVEHSGQLFDIKAPKSLDELQKWKPDPGMSDIPGKGRLREIETLVPDLNAKPLKYHHDMMENPKAMKALKLDFENLPTKDALKIAEYNQSMVNESASKIKETIKQLGGGDPKHISDSGNNFISVVKEKYQAEKSALKPAFEELRKTGGKLNATESRDLIQGIGSNSKVGGMIEMSDSGRFGLKKNTPRSGVSDSEHNIISRVIDDLNDGMTFKEIQDTRDFLRKAIDPTNPAATSEISNVRSILLDQLESMSKSRGPGVHETFRSYAKNERARESIEKIIGGKVESLDAMFAANPEKIVHKIFSNPNHTKIVAEYAGPEAMQQMTASYIQNGLKKSFDAATGFNPSGVRTWMKANENFLRSNVSPEVTQRLQALADYGYYGKRYLDEVNPSGTAASLIEALQPRSFVTKIRQEGLVGSLVSEASQRVGAVAKQRQAVNAVNESLGAAPKASIIDLSKFKAASGKAIDVGARSQAPTGAVRNLLQEKPPAKSADQKEEDAPMRPLKGREKWADEGFNKLLEDAPELEKIKGALFDDPKAKDLIIQASDLKPGSKAMINIVSKLKQKLAGRG